MCQVDSSKYIVWAPGNCGSVRLVKLLASDCAVLKLNASDQVRCQTCCSEGEVPNVSPPLLLGVVLSASAPLEALHTSGSSESWCRRGCGLG